MTLPLIVYRSLRQHALSTCITVAGIALACGLLMCVWMVKTQSQAAFTQTTTGLTRARRAARSCSSCSTRFSTRRLPGNLAYADYEAIKRHPAVKARSRSPWG